MSDFSNKTVWITGASSGIGEALAYAFASVGAGLILSARTEAALQQVAKNCLEKGASSAKVLVLDVADNAALAALAANFDASVGQVDVLVNNSGISQRSTVSDTNMEVYRRMMEVNFFGTVALTKMVLPGMLKKGSGQLIAISSVAGKIGTPMRSGYCASKHALHGFFDSLRAEVEAKGVNVLVVCPGYINTSISKNALDASGVPTGKMDANQAKGMAPALLAKKILHAMQMRKDEIYIGGKEIMGIYIKRFFPALLKPMLRKMGNPK